MNSNSLIDIALTELNQKEHVAPYDINIFGKKTSVPTPRCLSSLYPQ